MWLGVPPECLLTTGLWVHRDKFHKFYQIVGGKTDKINNSRASNKKEEETYMSLNQTELTILNDLLEHVMEIIVVSLVSERGELYMLLRLVIL